MNWLVALAIGIGLGLACFGGLWLTVRQLIERPRRSSWVPLSQLGRLVLCALVFCLLSRSGLGAVLSALAGFWLARWHLVRMLGGVAHGR